MRPRTLMLAIAALVTIWAFLPGARAAEPETVRYFYLNACEGCHPEEDFEEEFFRLTGAKLSDFHYTAYNVFKDGGRRAYEQATAGLSEAERKLPLVIVGAEIYAGSDAIGRDLPARFGAAGSGTGSLVYFLATPACESCTQAREAIDALPQVLAVSEEGRLFSSRLEVREIDVARQPEMATALFERYAVPDAERIAPSVFLGDMHFSGAEAIRTNLRAALEKGEGIGTPLLEAGASSPMAAALPGAFVAGLAAGFNPCALSMLLLFVGLIVSMRRNPLGPGLMYLAGKLCVYLGIGFVFSWLWIEYAPEWLSLAARVFMTAAGLALIAMNLWDALQAHRAQYGKVVNQLPGRLRAGLQRAMRGILSKSGALLGVSAYAMGAMVAGGEFLCAGQLYAAALIAGAQTGMEFHLPLIVYCLAFILPSAAVLAVVRINHRTMEASDWVLKRMPAIKLATASVLALILIFAWVF